MDRGRLASAWGVKPLILGQAGMARSVSETFALNPFLDQLMLCIAGPWKKASRHTWYRYQLLYRQQACTCGENKLAGLMRVRMHLAISK